jgi:acyl dehydratase
VAGRLTCAPVTALAPRDRAFDDFVVGETFEFGFYEVTEAEIVAFGRSYDPQPFHTDPEAARDSIFGGLIASGWHTCAMAMRLLVDNFLSPAYSLGSPGIDDLRFLAPVRPGTRLHLRIVVADLVPSRSKADRGLVRLHIEVMGGADAVVSMTTLGLWARRPS